ncbi:MAG: zinc-ribbon domain-containing protein, partial [Coriobacteriia bacterium]|nr:zinc-ribbon domain-containing protein [Coriobacteriia bacterium]
MDKSCPKCGNQVPGEALFCTFCGAAMSTEPVAPEPAAPEQQAPAPAEQLTQPMPAAPEQPTQPWQATAPMQAAAAAPPPPPQPQPGYQ